MKAYMGLTCKVGAYVEVLKRLLNLCIRERESTCFSEQDIFLLFGPIDILIPFSGLKSLDEFIEKAFNPVRNIGAEEDLITKTLSLIVISEGPPLREKPFAFLFINTKPKSLEGVRTKLLTIPNILTADSVLGPYDIICAVKAKDHIELEQTVLNIQNIPGVESLMTSIVAPIKVLPEL
ncbi:MAG: Lrp/AsnC ligand binding domain-containing protein [Candidatus Bathyarchaeia archaeon]|nr:Lrp/AsnC ligand binding domain-containing protein [Candidatus Bathyarchaeota archaeon]